jgi:hypothetical protein
VCSGRALGWTAGPQEPNRLGDAEPAECEDDHRTVVLCRSVARDLRWKSGPGPVGAKRSQASVEASRELLADGIVVEEPVEGVIVVPERDQSSSSDRRGPRER